MVKNKSKHEAFESKTGDGSRALRVEKFSAADFFGFTDYLGFHGINSFGKGFVKIFMIVFVGILSYSAVVLPGYFYFVPGGAEEISNLKTLTELPVEDAANSSTKLNIANPGDAPPLK